MAYLPMRLGNFDTGTCAGSELLRLSARRVPPRRIRLAPGQMAVTGGGAEQVDLLPHRRRAGLTGHVGDKSERRATCLLSRGELVRFSVQRAGFGAALRRTSFCARRRTVRGG